jgi:hypothetical protein
MPTKLNQDGLAKQVKVFRQIEPDFLNAYKKDGLINRRAEVLLVGGAWMWRRATIFEGRNFHSPSPERGIFSPLERKAGLSEKPPV